MGIYGLSRIGQGNCKQGTSNRSQQRFQHTTPQCGASHDNSIHMFIIKSCLSVCFLIPGVKLCIPYLPLFCSWALGHVICIKNVIWYSGQAHDPRLHDGKDLCSQTTPVPLLYAQQLTPGSRQYGKERATAASASPPAPHHPNCSSMSGNGNVRWNTLDLNWFYKLPDIPLRTLIFQNTLPSIYPLI